MCSLHQLPQENLNNSTEFTRISLYRQQFVTKKNFGSEF